MLLAKVLRPAACAIIALVVGVTTSHGQQFATDPPPITSEEWFTWYSEMVAQRLAECPIERATTYHFSQSGDDVLGNGTQSAPFRTLAKARSLIVASAAAGQPGNIALLFKRGDIWRETTGLMVSRRNITIGAWGDAQLAKPKLTTFQPISPAGWTPTVGRPGVYQRAEALPVSWVKETDDYAYPMSRQRSLATVAANPSSWFWEQSTGTLYVRPMNDTDPRVDGKPWELTRPTDAGIAVETGGVRVDSISAEGWGMSNQVSATQRHGIIANIQGTEVAVISNCDAFYASSHAMAQYGSGAGGISVWYRCRAGLCNQNASYETIFNTYSLLGGVETVFHECEVTHGTLPSEEWNFLQNKRRGLGFYGHSGASQTPPPNRLIVVYRASIPANRYGAAMPSSFANMPDAQDDINNVRCFLVEERFEGSPGEQSIEVAPRNVARVNGVYRNISPNYPQHSLANGPARGWAINCTFDIDLTVFPHYYGAFNGPINTPSTVKFWHCQFNVRTVAGSMFVTDYDAPTQSAGGEMLNCVFSHSTMVGGSPRAFQNFGAAGSPLVAGNAFFGFSTTQQMYDAQPLTIPEALPPEVRPTCASALAFNAAVRNSQVRMLRYDQSRRVGSRRTIGPLEADLCADVNSDGLLTIEDLYRWEATPTDVNGDGQINDADRAVIVRAVRWGETSPI